MKRSLSLLLAVPLMMTGCSGSTVGEQASPSNPKVAPSATSIPALSSTSRQFISAADRTPARPQLIDRTGSPKRAMRSAKAKAAVVTCDVAQYASLSGATLVKYIQDAGNDCVNNLFAGNSNTYAAFTRAKMSDVASYTASYAASYTGVDTSNLEALYGFLRAGYYVGFYFSANLDWQITDASLKASMRQAIDAFVNNAHFYDASDAHGSPLREALTLIDSSDNQASYLHVVKGWLTRWNQTHSTFWYMRGAVNEIFQILFRGHQQADFKVAVQSDTTLVANLSSFVDQTWMLNTDSQFILENAARELARLIQYKTAPIYPTVKAKAQAILARYTLTDPLYFVTADMVNYYDNCANYGTCTFKQDLEARILPTKHVCSSTIQIRAQSMTASELSSSCAILQAEETYFHQKLATNNQPIPGDQNSFLDVVIFDSSADYGKYAGVLFGIDTNNGGMYIEGYPDTPGNQAHFYCYEAEWARPNFEVWNLKHEYVHYLDGRFNMKGGFNDYLTAKTIWWIEGLGEYVSHQDDYAEAITLAKTKQYRLSQVFGNTYSSGQDLVYRWGYLAVRFMFERHHADVNTILGFFRPGNYTGYSSWLNGILNAYDTEFTTWLDTVQSNPNPNPNPNPSNQVPVAMVNGPYSGTAGVAISFSSAGSYDPDGTVASYAWSFGDGTTSTQSNPSKSYTVDGTYTVTLTVKDNMGASSVAATTTVTISGGGGGGTCTVGAPVDYVELKSGVSVCVSPSTTTPTAYFYVYIQPGATRLTATLSGGTGDADLYGSSITYADSTSFEASSVTPGTNNETLSVALTTSGWYYVTVATTAAHSGATLTVTVQ